MIASNPTPEGMAQVAAVVLLAKAAASFPHTDIKTACDTRGVSPLHHLAQRIRNEVYAELVKVIEAAPPESWTATQRRLMESVDVTDLTRYLRIEVAELRHREAVGWRKVWAWCQLKFLQLKG